MKILFISSANRNGISPIVYSQGESLRKMGIVIDYFGVTGKGFFGYLKNISKLRKRVRETNPDLLHAHYSLSAMMARLANTHMPMVVSLMGSDTKVSGFKKKITNFFVGHLWNRIIVKSDSMKKDMELVRSLVIPNGVDMTLFKPMDSVPLKKKFGFVSAKKTILFLANPDRYEKNFPLAKAAFELIKSESIELQVLFNIPHEEIPQILNAADVLLLSSFWEGSPNIVKEAMACNCSVVATNVGDVKWLFGEEPGYFVTDFNATNVAKNIKKALEFSEEQGRTNGRDRIIKLELDSDSVAQKIIAIYQSVIDENISKQ